MFRSFLAVCTAVSLLSSSSLSFAESASAQAVDRPPQYIAISFDGSYNNAMWDQIHNFSERVKNTSPVKFTFFVSGVYFLKRMSSPRAGYPRVNNEFNQGCEGYNDCGRRKGGWWNTHRYYELPKQWRNGNPRYDVPAHSAIGFGDYNEDIVTRMKNVNRAYAHGHEIGSHANAHVDGTMERWAKEDWDKEFEQFADILYNYAEINNINNNTLGLGPFAADKPRLLRELRNNPTMKVPNSDLMGFRAPQLGVGRMSNGEYSVFPALDDSTYKYDASLIRKPHEWPKKEYASDIVVMPLHQLKIVKRNSNGVKYESDSKVPSMDYNFYFKQTNAVPIPAETEAELATKRRRLAKYKREMKDTYQKYFEGNYYGNRAPIHIGHHFSRWNAGIYWEALQEFITENCGKAEVKCVTYKELYNFIESKSSNEIHAYESGSFTKLSRTGGQRHASLDRATMEIKTAAAERSTDRLVYINNLDLPKGVTASRVRFEVNGEAVSEADMASGSYVNISFDPRNGDQAKLVRAVALDSEGSAITESNVLIGMRDTFTSFNPETLRFDSAATDIAGDVGERLAEMGDSVCAHDEKAHLGLHDHDHNSCNDQPIFRDIISAENDIEITQI